MISRYYVICGVCKTHHTLRIQMGYGGEQKHRFTCHHCNEPIAFEFNSRGIEVTGATLTSDPQGADAKTTYQYLSPDFVADSARARDPRYFGSMEIMSALADKPEIAEAMRNLPRHRPREIPWFALANASSDWSELQVCWRLERGGHYALMADRIDALDPEADGSAWFAAVNLGHRMFDVDTDLLNEVTEIIKANPVESGRLVCEYAYRWAADLAEGEFTVFSEFFRRWDAFSQVYLYVKNDLHLPGDPAATSYDFERVRGFYSLAQEFFSNQVRTLTALNNVKAGRSFDMLGQISLEKYMTSDNAKRRDNFKLNDFFFRNADEYDSGLRNAEAHNWLRADSKTHLLHYQQGGNGSPVTLRYVDYLNKSMHIFRQICRLMQVEYLLKSAAQASAYQLFMPNARLE